MAYGSPTFLMSWSFEKTFLSVTSETMMIFPLDELGKEVFSEQVSLLAHTRLMKMWFQDRD